MAFAASLVTGAATRCGQARPRVGAHPVHPLHVDEKAAWSRPGVGMAAGADGEQLLLSRTTGRTFCTSTASAQIATASGCTCAQRALLGQAASG